MNGEILNQCLNAYILISKGHSRTEKEVKWKMNKDRNLRINYTQVTAERKEVGGKYDNQRARERGTGICVKESKEEILEVWDGNTVKGQKWVGNVVVVRMAVNIPALSSM